MEKPVVEILSEEKANIFFKGRRWKRHYAEKYSDPVTWYDVTDGEPKEVSNKRYKILEETYRDPDLHKTIQRCSRLGIPDRIRTFYEIPATEQFQNVSKKWTVDGMFHEGFLTLLTAPPAGFKTWLGLILAGAVSQGTEFLGRKTVQRPVLYLDLENPLSVIRERLDILNIEESYFFKIWGRWMENDPPPLLGDKTLLQIARQLRPFIIIDSYRRFHSADENNPQQMAEVSDGLRDLTDAGSDVLLLYHPDKAKSSNYRGTTEIVAGVDAAFALSKRKSKHKTILTLDCFKHRIRDEFDISFTLDCVTGRFELLDDDSTSGISSAILEKITTAIADQPGITQQELLKKAGLPETNGRKILQQGNGTHWFSTKGKGTTLHYNLKT